MPCYEPPPAWAGDAQTNSEEASKILCAMVQSASSYVTVPKPLLEWYLRHRMIDLERANDARYAHADSIGELRAITIDIEVVRDALDSMP